jgi:hypothetical protein
MELPRSALCPSRAPFHGIVPRAVVTHVDHITLPLTFGIRENFRTENLQFEVVDFETAYNAFLGRPTLTKFMMIPHYAYLVLMVLGPHGVISIRGDITRAYDYDKESCEMADRLAWKPADMPGVPRELIEHELHLKPKAKPIKE